MRFDLDLARTSPRPANLGWVLLVLGFIATAWAGWRFESESTRFSEAQAALQKNTQADRHATNAGRTTTQTAAPRVRSAREEMETAQTRNVQQLLTADWSTLLDTLETSRPADIALMGVEATIGRGDGGSNTNSPGKLTLTANARNLPAMLSYVAKLQATGFSQVSLDNHAAQEEADEGDESVIRFTVHASWGDLTKVSGSGHD